MPATCSRRVLWCSRTPRPRRIPPIPTLPASCWPTIWPGTLTTQLCCESCHQDAELNDGYLVEVELPDGTYAQVCCAVQRALLDVPASQDSVGRPDRSSEPDNPTPDCNCPVRDGNVYHQRASCTDPVVAKLGWYDDVAAGRGAADGTP